MRTAASIPASPTPGLLITLALVAALLTGVLALVRPAALAAQSSVPPLQGAFPDGMRDDLPPSIRKARPSSSVPADLPGRAERDCAVLRSVEVYQGVGPRTAVAVSPADLPGATPDGPCPPTP
jgi:uncharacterized iron-regulated membrane protein